MDINEQIVRTNALLVETLGKLSRAEGEIQSLQQEKEKLVDDNEKLRKRNSGECNTLTKENADLEKERHRLRSRVEELEDEIDGLKKRVRELEEKCSATDAIYSGSDEAGERDETLMKTEARNFVWKPRKGIQASFVFCCIEICEKSGYAYGFTHELRTEDRMKKIDVPPWYCPGVLSDKTPTAVLLDQSMQLIDFGLMAEHRYVEMLEEECVDCFLFRLRRTRNEKILQMVCAYFKSC
ncbi:uncharacterized protein LOC128245962 [Mya arenaria]|uniref:uncharacterized protein LOC128245962 n=1 Tax=Mya arenaria TaxID=6604 RepID=UPI0022E7340F|nr:uncharacterized protein LOC128245962 [Mya arenaria]